MSKTTEAIYRLLYPRKAELLDTVERLNQSETKRYAALLDLSREQQEQITYLERDKQFLQDESDTTIAALRDSISVLGLYLQDYGLEQAPRDALRSLQESGVDEALLLDLTTQIGWDQIATMGASQAGSQQRGLAMSQSERLWMYSPIYQWSVWLWTGWGLGENVTATLPDENAQQWWDEFFFARRNRAVLGREKIHSLSDWLLVKGNRFLVLFTATAGENAGRTTIRTISGADPEPIYNPGDKAEVWFWKRAYTENGKPEKTLYYPSWETSLSPELEERWRVLIEGKKVPGDAKRADLRQAGTTVCIQHVAHNRKVEDSPLGWPLSTTAAPWIRGHKRFAESRLGVALAIAQFVRRTQVSGGSRAVESVINTIASTLSQSSLSDRNPPGAAGSWHVENKASDTTELPMRTGASDAKADNETFSWMALLGAGLFPTSAGLDTSRWATALEMDKAQSMIFERYQDLWIESMETLCYAVLSLADKYGDASIEEKNRVAQISIDSFSLSDFPSVAKAIGSFASQMLTPMVQNGVIDLDAAAQLTAELWRISLQALGVNNAADLAAPELFRPEQPEEPPPPADTGLPDEDEEIIPAEEMLGKLYERALDRYRRGEITSDQLAQFVLSSELDKANG